MFLLLHCCCGAIVNKRKRKKNLVVKSVGIVLSNMHTVELLLNDDCDESLPSVRASFCSNNSNRSFGKIQGNGRKFLDHFKSNFGSQIS